MAPKDEKRKNLKYINERYQQRMSLVKLGHDALYKKDYLRAIKYYNNYLKLLADVKETELNLLAPSHFDSKQEKTEMLLISHIYWEQSKILDKTAKLYDEFLRSLSKFIEFSLNQDYQVVNSEMLRKYVRSGKMIHKKEFNEAYKKIYQTTNKCFIATYCFGKEDPILAVLRELKCSLLNLPGGNRGIELYYRFSPSLINYLDRHPLIANSVTNLFFRPTLKSIAFFFSYFRRLWVP